MAMAGAYLTLGESRELIAESLRAGRDVRFIIRTGSMRPMLGIGDRVVVRSASSGTPNVGEVVLTRAGNGKGWVAHRLIIKSVDAEGFRFKTKGDNSPSADDAVGAAEIAGVVVSIESGESQASLDTRVATLANHSIAKMSLVQSLLFDSRPGPLRTFSLALLALLLRVSGRITRYCVGLR